MPDVYRLRIEGSGRINDTEYTAAGDGTCDPEAGDIRFQVAFSQIASNADPLGHLLAVLIIPTVFGRERGGARNLLTVADGAFEFTQSMAADDLTVESCGSMEKVSAREIVWRSSARGHVRIGRVARIDPFTAVMIPQGGGRMLDVLSIPLIETDRTTVVHAVRSFDFRADAVLEQQQLRRISIRTEVEARRITATITSEMSPFPKPN